MMRRRDFLRATGLGALALTLPRIGRAAPPGLTDKLWILVDANGAWDPTFFCDPQIHPDFVNPALFGAADLKTTGTGVTYAPFASGVPYVGMNGATPFFEKYADRLMVLNGYDGQTNNHVVGSRNTWSGSLGVGYPSFAALVAAAHGEVAPTSLPLAFLTTGGFDGTAGLLPATRVGQTAPLLQLTYPNRKKVDEPNLTYLHEDALQAVRDAQALRTERLLEEQGLPQIKAGLKRLMSAKGTEKALANLMGPLNDAALLPPVNNAASPLLSSARVILAAMKAGICVSGNLSMAGFDTHSNHDTDNPMVGGQRPVLQQLFSTVDYLWDRAEALGLADRLVVVVGSDFGRTKYNSPVIQDGDGANTQAGKDHWPITSLMVMSKDLPPGVVGATQTHPEFSGVIAHPLAISGGKAVIAPEGGPNTTLLRQVHIHHLLRCMAGMKNHPLAQLFPVHRPNDMPLPLGDVPGWQSFT
jgi:hypothetical protein